MRKFILCGAALLAAIGFTACCSGNGKSCDNKCSDKEEVYTGVLPAADADGMRYTLSLDYDDDNNNLDGDFESVETYFRQDTVAPAGIKDVKSFYTKGDFKVVEGTGDNAGKKYIKLEPKRGGEGSTFLIESDSTLVQVNSNFEVAEAGAANYTLSLVK